MAEKSPREGVLPVCRHHQRGFCKHADKCHKHHVNEICSTIPCKDLNCTKRHPKKCKYFEENNFCKFNTKCAYSHEKPEISVEVKYALEEIQKLKDEIKELKDNMNNHTQQRQEKNSAEKSIEVVKSEIEKLKLENINILHMISLFEEPEVKMTYFKCDLCDSSFISERALNEHVKLNHPSTHSENKSEEFQCVMCDYKCTRNATLNKHINSKHPNSVKTNPFKCNLCDWISADEELI